MALFDIKTQTTVGRNYLTQAVAGSKIIWDSVKVSTDYFSNPVGLTDLTNVVITSPVDYAKQVSSEQFDIGGHVDSSGVHSDTIIKTWGLYGHVGTDNSQLLAVLSSQSGQTLYANTTDIQTIKETFSLVFPNPSNTPISFVVSNSGFALDDNVVHTTGDETASGVKNFQDGVQSGGKNVVTQNGDDTINVANGSTNNVIEPVDKSKIKDSIIQASLSSSDNIDNLENDGRYPFDSVVISGIDPNNTISGYLDQSTNGSTVIQGTVYTVGTTKYVKYRSKSNGVWSDWNTSASVADMEVELANKVTDNHDGTEQLNGVQVQPFNKLADTEDHRNYLTGTGNDLVIGANSSNFNFYRLFYPLVPGQKYTFSSEVTLTGSTNNIISVRVYQSDGNSNTVTINDAFVADGTRQSWTFVCPSNGYYLFVYAGVTGHTANIGATFHHSQLELGLPTPWHPSVLDKADDSTVLHNTGLGQITTDNSGIIVGNDGDFGIIKRSGHKAGIAIGSGNNFHFMTTSDAVLSNNSLYSDVWDIAPTGQISILGGAYFTPADDSKAVHKTGYETINGIKLFQDGLGSVSINSTTASGLLPNNALTDLANGSDSNYQYYITGVQPTDAPYASNLYGMIEIKQYSANNKWIVFYDNVKNCIYVKNSSGGTWGSWDIIAKDSKVAHLSGANNFDTVPTVNDNPLLLASSLPSDLARTGQDQEFTGKNTFDTAPIDKATGNPYITKDGVPSDVARTGQSQTFTQPQTFSSAPTVIDTSTTKEDNQVALMGDLKSVKESAWRQLDSSLITIDYASSGNYYTDCLYRIDPVNKKIYIHWIIQCNYGNYYGNAHLDFSSVVSNFTSKGTGNMMYQETNNYYGRSAFSISGSKISVAVADDTSLLASGFLEDCWFGYDTLLI